MALVPYIVLIENPQGNVEPMWDEDEDGNRITMRFATREEAAEATSGAMWEHAWTWWVVELTPTGNVTFQKETL
jgi:hypothetical protein